MVVAGTATSLVLASLALILPVEDIFFVGPWTIRMAETWSFLGRRLELGGDDRPALMALYFGTAFWFGAAYIARPGRIFVPLGMGIVALFTAAIAVEPFLYAALIIATAVILSIPLLITTGHVVGRGVLRYLTFQTLGIPFILFSGWTLTGSEISPPELGIVTRASVLLGLGFVFLLAVFPFHTWIPMLAEESHPYAAAFVFLMLPGAVLFFGLGFLDRYAWLRNSETVYLLLRSVGIWMVILAGVLAAYQRNLGRMLGFAVIVEMGFGLVVVGLAQGDQTGEYLSILFASLLPRGFALGVWALALTVIRSKTAGLNFRDVQGIARQAPIAAASLMLAHFSIAGLPLLAGFPLRMAVMDGLAEGSLTSALWTLIGSAGLFGGGLRTLAVLIMGQADTNWTTTETPAQTFFLSGGCLVLVAAGILPHVYLPLFADIPLVFRNLVP